MSEAGKSHTTTNHKTIREWMEDRGGHPAKVKGTDDKHGGLLRVDFGRPEENLERIEWEEFFETFDANKLAFLYQEEIHGHKSRFCKFVNRD